MIEQNTSHQPSAISHQQNGFTLIELLVVIALVITVGGITVSIFFSALRSSSKSNSLSQVRQSGDYAITQMSKMITFAKYFNGVSVDNITYKTSCVGDATAYKYVKITAFDSGVTTFSCPLLDTDVAPIASKSAASTPITVNLTDPTLNLAGANCHFYCYQTNALNSPTVKIDFTLVKGTAASNVESQASIHFQTSVTPRN
jgi:prepilin-type N-terminal cleavage/methylation domain-containing protein